MNMDYSKVISMTQAKEALREGQVGVIPTDTLYGVVCAADNQDAVGCLYRAKQRENKPGTIIAASVDQLRSIGLVASKELDNFLYWPGSVSVILNAPDKLSYIHGGVGSIAARVVAPQVLRELLADVGPLLTSSANITGHQPAVSVAEAMRYFGLGVDFYVDGGHIMSGAPSTIVRYTSDGSLDIVRAGAVNIK
jgi:L-threonylcarbamoyladenylate synthase